MTRKESGWWLEDAKRLLDVYGKAVVRVTSETTGEHIGAVMAAEDDLRLHLTSLQSAAEGLEEALKEMRIDMKIAQGNMRHAAKRDPNWEGCAETLQHRVDQADAALAAFQAIKEKQQ